MPRKENAFNIDSLMESERNNIVPMAISQQPTVNNPIGRPKSRRTCSKENGSPQIIFFTKEEKKAINTCSFFSGFDQQDIIRCAVRQFLNGYTNPKTYELAEEGRGLIQEYIDSTTL